MDEDNVVYLVGTSHASNISTRLVTELIGEIRPDFVCLELDNKRLEANLKQMNSDVEQKERSLTQVLRQSDTGLMGSLILLTMSKIQSNISDKLDIDIIGNEMMTGFSIAQDLDIPVALIDRQINDTVDSLSEHISIYKTIKIVFSSVFGYIYLNTLSKKKTQEITDPDSFDMDEIHDKLASSYPVFNKVIIEERNKHMCNNISKIFDSQEDPSELVSVVGKGHVKGMKRILEEKGIDVNVINSSKDI